MTDIGLKRSSADPGLYIRNKGLAVGVHVDDLIGKAADSSTLDWLTKELRQRLEIKDMERPSLILPFTVSYNQGGVILNQKRYLQGILQKWYGYNSTAYRPQPRHLLSLSRNKIMKREPISHTIDN
jgi:hypothetical protein